MACIVVHLRWSKLSKHVYYYGVGLAQHLRGLGHQIEVIDKSSLIRDNGVHLRIDLDNGYWLWDDSDWCNPRHSIAGSCPKDPDCLGIFKTNWSEPHKLHAKVHRWMIWPRDPNRYFGVLDSIRAIGYGSVDRLFWRGRRPEYRRKFLAALESHLDPDFKVPLEMVDFVTSLRTYKMFLSLRGLGKWCFRDIEGMGVGGVMLADCFPCEMINMPINGVHYVAPDEPTPEGILEKYLEVREDTKLCREISQNAIEWFDQTIRPPTCYVSVCRTMGLG